MSIKDFFESKSFKKVIWCMGILIAVLIIFQAGIFVGFHQADFSYKGGENYYRTFGGGSRESMHGFIPGIPPEEFSQAHGVSGKIIKIDLPNIFIEGNDAIEKSILIGDDTIIKRFRQTQRPTDLKVDDDVIIIGSPNSEGQIEAKLIRVIMSTATTSIPTK